MRRVSANDSESSQSPSTECHVRRGKSLGFLFHSSRGKNLDHIRPYPPFSDQETRRVARSKIQKNRWSLLVTYTEGIPDRLSIRLMDIRIHSVYVKEGPRQSSHRQTSVRAATSLTMTGGREVSRTHVFLPSIKSRA